MGIVPLEYRPELELMGETETDVSLLLFCLFLNMVESFVHQHITVMKIY
jgi:hypothetical protein